MRAVWVDEGNGPNWDKIHRNNITWVFVSLEDTRVTQHLQEILDHGFKAGVYAAWNWYPNLSGAEFATRVHTRLKAVWPQATNGFPKVQLNDETHDPARIVGMLRQWRKHRPGTDTSWTLEGMQGGWFTPELVQTVITSRVRVVPQAYYGSMAPGQVYDSLATARDLTKRGIPDKMISPFYDGAQLPAFWEGWAFTQGRLP